jgi:DNA-binding protein HU-beta
MSKSKSDLISEIATKAGITKAQATVAFDTFKDFVVENANEKVMLMGFGTFSVQNRAAREGKDPTGKVIQISAKNLLKFKASKEITEKLK